MIFTPVDWEKYNKPPYFPQWLATGETLLRAKYDDPLLADIDAVLRDISGQYDIETVKGILLDRIGKILAEPRQGNDDTLYRLMLKLRILLNTADGTLNNVIKIIKFFYSSEEVHIAPDYPAGISILHDGEGPNLDFNRIIAALVPAGVSYNTKEVFYFSYDFPFEDAQNIEVKKSEIDVFPSGLRRNGRILRDHGKCTGRDSNMNRAGGYTHKDCIPIAGTVLDTVQMQSRRDGSFHRGNEITRTGLYSIPATESISVPAKYTSNMNDMFDLSFALDGFTDTYRTQAYHNGEIQRDGSNLDALRDLPMPICVRKLRRRDGSILRDAQKRDGSASRNGMIDHFVGGKHSGDDITEENV
jgi:hypothetical protein